MRNREISYISEGRRKKEKERRKKENAILAMISAIKSVLTVLVLNKQKTEANIPPATDTRQLTSPPAA
ncbi:MAG: hypothetical protein ICV80_16325 [Microcoleus sp. T1-bin1]|nr:hypothetical protein [Microcoleus sp. T1-bin1]